jgi:enoyl-CoA hydratase/carnithine racemase
MDTTLRWDVDGALLRITIDRPDKKNALTQAMYAGMADALEHAEHDRSVRAVLITGTGNDFCAGNDLADFAMGSGADEHGGSPTVRFLHVLATATVPVVAAVQGVAIGVGTTMLLHCDLVYASPDARLRLPFVDLGLVPEAASSLLLPQLVGHQRAAEILYTGRFVGADEAYALGLVTAVVPAAELGARAEAAAVALTTKPPVALRRTKALLRSTTTTVPERMAEEGKAFAEQLGGPEFTEASAAFFEKRPPRF